MKIIIIFLLFTSCAMQKKDPCQKVNEEVVKQIWLDGCVFGIIKTMIKTGIRRKNIPVFQIVEHCYEYAEPRLKGDVRI